MPRELPAALTTVMDAGAYEPYLRVSVSESGGVADEQLFQPLGFKLESLKATVTIQYAEPLDYGASVFRIIRGALINGTPSTISSIWFVVIDFRYDGKFVTLEGEAITRLYTTATADSDYETVIETALTNAPFDPLIPNYEGAAAWKAYQFYPTGRTIVLSPTKKIFTLLQQKYLVFAVEDGWDGTDSNIFFFVATDARSTDYTVEDKLFNYNSHLESRRLISRDESNVITSTGDATATIHNLGFLHSTATQPTNAQNYTIGRSSNLPVHLKRRTGDKVTITRNGVSYGAIRIKVTEVLDTEATPAWYQIVEGLQWYGTTEGGAMPSTIEAAAPYTPLVTGHFDGVLSLNDNNLQAAMETIDDHDHGGLATSEGIQDIVGAMFTGNTETGGNLTYQDSDGTIDLEVTDATISTSDITTNNASTSKHGFLKKLSNVASEFMDGIGNWTRNITAVQTLFTHGNNAAVPASTTYYLNLATYGLQTAISQIALPACTAQNLILATNSAQPASGSLVVTVQKGGVDTAITFTIAAGTAAGTFTDTTHSVAFAASDGCTVKIVNNATAASALIIRCSLQIYY